jgi:pilus assembly protein Flp/PilA
MQRPLLRRGDAGRPRVRSGGLAGFSGRRNSPEWVRVTGEWLARRRNATPDSIGEGLVAAYDTTSLVNGVQMRSDESGQGLAEFALILALIAIVAISALLFLGGGIDTILSAIASPR